jgi:D-glycero-D-manno-heptose 1,7-bisphosphate phosphatase
MKAVFLDRDGVINIDTGYVGKIDDFVFRDGIFEFLKFFQKKGYELFIVTNQSGIARGYYSEDDFKVLTTWMIQEFAKEEIIIKDVHFCPHHPDINGECSCRKPNEGMILDLSKKYNINLEKSFMIGDSIRDIEAGKRAGIQKNYLVTNGILNTLNEIISKENL